MIQVDDDIVVVGGDLAFHIDFLEQPEWRGEQRREHGSALNRAGASARALSESRSSRRLARSRALREGPHRPRAAVARPSSRVRRSLWMAFVVERQLPAEHRKGHDAKGIQIAAAVEGPARRGGRAYEAT